MPSGRNDIAKDGKATQFPHNDPTKGGRKPSIRKQLKELMLTDGRLKIPKENVLSIDEDGSVIIKVPTEMQHAMKLNQLAMSGKNSTTLKAVLAIIEQTEGKLKEEIDSTIRIKSTTIKWGDGEIII